MCAAIHGRGRRGGAYAALALVGRRRRERGNLFFQARVGGESARPASASSLPHPSSHPIPSLPPSQILVAQKVATGVYKGVTTTELDELAAETAAAMTATHPDYAVVR